MILLRRLILALAVATALVLAAGLPPPVAAAPVTSGLSAPPLWFPPARQARTPEPPPLRLAASKSVMPLQRFGKAAIEQQPALRAIADWNGAGHEPAKNGFARPLGQPAMVELSSAMLAKASAGPLEHGGGLLAVAGDDLVWGGEVRVEGAYRLRVKLGEVRLPAAARVWIYGQDGEIVGPFGIEAVTATGRDGGVLWSPSVAGPAARIEVAVPRAALAQRLDLGFAVEAVMEIVRLSAAGVPLALGPPIAPPPVAAGKLGECLISSECSGDVPLNPATLSLVSRAVADLQFVSGGESYTCTGGLINDTASSGVPYLLTANHCISAPGEAASLEAFWDYVEFGCGGQPPPFGALERSFSSTLLATGAASDFTLLELVELPPGRVFFGWSSDPMDVLPGVELHRLSHPLGLVQSYSRSSVLVAPRACQGAPQPQFIYHTTNLGGTFGGSSGAPLFLESGQIVGQLAGGCSQVPGSDPFDGCDYDNAEVDGAFAATFSSVAQFLGGAPVTPCVNSDTDLCLYEDRFRVEVDWRTRAGNSGSGKVVPFRSDNSGLYYFFKASNWEMLIKVLNGCTLNSRYWVFFAATTNVELTVTVTDTQTGRLKQYFNPLGQSADAVTDTEAFAVCP